MNAVDYLLKPFSFNEFSRSCEKIRRYLEMSALSAREESLVLHFKADYRIISVEAGKIVYVESLGEYVKVFLSNSETPIVVLYSLKHLIQQLPGDRFMRIHRSYIISLKHIAEASRTSVRLDNGVTLPVGESFRPAFAEYLASY